MAEYARRSRSDLQPARAGCFIRRGALATGRSRGRRGFTHVEVVAVLIVTAIMGAMAIGSLGSLSRSRAADAGRTVLRDVSFARDRAMATGLSHWMSFDESSSSYSVLVDETGAGFGSATPLIDPATGSAMVIRLNREQHSGVLVEYVSFDGESVVSFDWLGRPKTEDGHRLDREAQIQLSGGVTVSLNVTSGVPSLALP